MMQHQQKQQQPSRLLVIAFTNFLLVSRLASGSSLVSAAAVSKSQSSSHHSDKDDASPIPQLLVISLDGFRYDYYDHVMMRSLQSLTARGVHARKGMKGVFCTVTFPSHWTIVTGLYEESHGIIGNNFYDPISNRSFSMASREKYWYGGEPIWVTAKRQGRKTGVYFWVGSQVDQGRYNPDFAPPYDQSVPLRQRIDTVIKWLTEDHVDLAMMYWNQPDTAGHAYGVMSDQVVKELNMIDDELDRMLSILGEKGMLPHLNIIVTADHGMMNLTTDGEILIHADDPGIRDNVVRIPDSGIVVHFWTKEGGHHVKSLMQHLDILSSQAGMSHFDHWIKEEIPSKWHYRNSERIAPVVAVAHPGFTIRIVQVST